MDEPGFHARRRAAKEDAHYATVWRTAGHDDPLPLSHDYEEEAHIPSPPTGSHTSGSYRTPRGMDPNTISGPANGQTFVNNRTTDSLPFLSAVQRTLKLPSPTLMMPHLRFMCGPLLRYDTVIDYVWYGAAMIVTADQGSIYSPAPRLSLEWDPSRPLVPPAFRDGSTNPKTSTSSDIPLPFDPNASGHLAPMQPEEFTNGVESPVFQRTISNSKQISGEEIWVYHGNAGTFTFWRFMIEIPLSGREMGISYRINNGALFEFFVPARDQNFRWAAHSCNGFSAGVNQDDFRGPGFASGYDPLWVDLLNKHHGRPYHALVGGGDQIYCDKLTQEPEMQDWVTKSHINDKIKYPLTEEMCLAVDRFFFRHYCHMFRNGAFARALRTIPMVNMLDDHDIIDGFGSYPDNLQSSPVFSAIGTRGYFFYLLFQQFTVDAVDGTLDMHPHPNKALILGGVGPWIRSHSHSLLTYLGPRVQMLLLDCRAERRKDRVISGETYRVVLDRVRALPSSVEHLVVLLGVPIAYPRMNFLEAALESKLNPLIILARMRTLGLSALLNKFNDEAELLDDLNDHWTAKHHKAERNWFVLELQKIALAQKLRVTFVAGDVHCAAVGLFKTLTKSKRDVNPERDHRYMLNVVTSAIVNTPPPAAVLKLVGVLGKKTHKTLHHAQTDEVMVPLFKKDTDGTPLKANSVMGRRNWCQVEWDQPSGDLIFDIRVERAKGHGNSVSYAIRAPAPRWSESSIH